MKQFRFVIIIKMKISSAILTIAASIATVANAASISNAATNSSDTYDYVIVGGGVAGKLKSHRQNKHTLTPFLII